MAEREAVLFANEAFYLAFAARDVDAMDAVWARLTPVACIHPGWGPLSGRDTVMESWRAILTGSHAPDIRCLEPTAFFAGSAAFVICYEAIGDEFLIATNVFVKEEGHWRLAHHQAGPAPEPPPAPEAEEDTADTVH